MSIILGIDPSLTGTGLAELNTEDALVVETHTIATKGGKADTLDQRWLRLTGIVGVAVTYVDLAVIEAPAYASRTGHQHDRSGLWWLIVHDLLTHGVPVVEVTPQARMTYATGKGNAGKDEVLLAVARRYPHVDVSNNNEADALILAAIGHHLTTGHPLVDLPATHTRALDKVARPGSSAA